MALAVTVHLQPSNVPTQTAVTRSAQGGKVFSHLRTRSTNRPTDQPTNRPTNQPTSQPTNRPVNVRTNERTNPPTNVHVVVVEPSTDRLHGCVKYRLCCLRQSAQVEQIVHRLVQQRALTTVKGLKHMHKHMHTACDVWRETQHQADVMPLPACLLSYTSRHCL